MNILFYILLSAASLLIFYEDVRTRLVTLWKLIVFTGISSFFFPFTTEAADMAGSNAAFILLIYSALVLIYSFREKKLDLTLQGKTGLADGLILLAPALNFSTLLFLYFLFACLAVSAFYALLRAIPAGLLAITGKSSAAVPAKTITIPFAGLCAILFPPCMAALDLLQISRFSNTSLFEFFIFP